MPQSLAHRLLPAALILLTLFALALPMRFQRWIGWLGETTRRVEAPVSGPVNVVLGWLGVGYRPAQDEDAVRLLGEENEKLRAALLREVEENQRLREGVRRLGVLMAMPQTRGSRAVYAPVVGVSSDLGAGTLFVRAGSREGVSLDSVATASGVQVVGRVVEVSERMCSVLPITARSQGSIRAIVFTGADVSTGLECTLEPTGEGTLRGPVEDRRDPGTAMPIEPKAGQVVRLADPGRWPAWAQMMSLGTVESVEASPDQPLRKLIVVRPTVERVERVSEVVILTAPEEGR